MDSLKRPQPMASTTKNEKNKSKNRRKNTDKRLKIAETVDKYKCYQAAVQAPDHEVEFFERVYKDYYNSSPKSLREDFCGTFAVSCEWVRSGSARTAICVDLDPEPLDWGRDHNLHKLSSEQQQRVRILQQDVRKRNRPQVDILAAQNFSFWIFKTRSELLEYLKFAHANLKAKGVLVMDMMGGSACFVEDRRDPAREVGKGKNKFKYFWHQETFNPVTNEATFFISFKFKDGSKLDKAFYYDWRFWSIPEVRELLAEAGFSQSHVYWEQTDENGEDTDEYQRVDNADADESWISYLVAAK